MERLTKPDGNCFMPKKMVDDDRSYCEEYCHEPCGDDCPLYECFQKLADYEDAEEQGRLIEFPVAVGDRIYEPFGNGFINEGTVCELTKFYQELEIGVSFDGTPTAINTINADHIGKTVFCTREEAEAKLKEMEGNYVKI